MDDISKPKVVPTSDGPLNQPSDHVSIPVTRRPVSSAPLGSGSSVDGFVGSPAPSTVTPPPSEPVDNSPKSLDELDGPSVPEVGGAPELPSAAPEPAELVAPETPNLPVAEEPSFTAPTPIAAPETPKEKKGFEIPAETPFATDEPLTEGSVTTAPVKSASGHKGRGMVIFVAVLIALALVAGAGYAYWQNNKKKPAVTQPQTTNKTEEKTKNPATADDVQKASDSLDASLKKVDDTKDFQESDLTDTTLGL